MLWLDWKIVRLLKQMVALCANVERIAVVKDAMRRIAMVDVVVKDAKVDVAAYEAAGARGSTKDGGTTEKTFQMKMAMHRGNHRGDAEIDAVRPSGEAFLGLPSPGMHWGQWARTGVANTERAR